MIKTKFKITRWSKWIPLSTYVFDLDSFLIMGKINRKTGLIKFKTIRIAKYTTKQADLKFNDQFAELLLQ